MITETMEVVNLDPDFQPLSLPLGFMNPLRVRTFQFPGGEEHVEILFEHNSSKSVVITARIRNSQQFVQLLMATNVLKRKFNEIHLLLPYFPYARQDRVTSSQESFSLKVAADIINSQGYKTVTVLDPHSDVLTALIDHVRPIRPDVWIKNVIGNSMVIFPDAGALKRYHDLDFAEYAVAYKFRNPKDGKITFGGLSQSEVNSTCYILDDICDGGYTFSLLSSVLRDRGASEVNLVVSHGIFSQGPLVPGIDHIFTTDSFSTLYQQVAPNIIQTQLTSDILRMEEILG